MTDESGPEVAPTDGARRALIDDLKAGEESAYAALVHEHFAGLRDYAFSYVRSWDEAADVVQEVFVNLYLTRDRLRDDEPMHLYLYAAVRNRALNADRSRRVRQRWTDRVRSGVRFGTDMAANDGEHEALRGEIADRVRTLIDQLPPKCKDAFTLVRLHGLTYDEAAEVLGVLKSTIATHLVRATKILGRQLAELGLVDGAVRLGAGKDGEGPNDE